MSEYAMPPETARALVAALDARAVDVRIGGGWAVDALVGRQTRDHSDLDVWVEAKHAEGLLAVLTEAGIDRIHPWPGGRPWNFVLHDGLTRRVDLHFYESVGSGLLQYGSVLAPFTFSGEDLAGRGEIAGTPVRCERPEFALRNRTGYEPRDSDRHDVAMLCEHFGLRPPDGYA
jgi:lincosamide nucleotidyltransferase A/C/D/E